MCLSWSFDDMFFRQKSLSVWGRLCREVRLVSVWLRFSAVEQWIRRDKASVCHLWSYTESNKLHNKHFILFHLTINSLWSLFSLSPQIKVCCLEGSYEKLFPRQQDSLLDVGLRRELWNHITLCNSVPGQTDNCYCHTQNTSCHTCSGCVISKHSVK